MLCGLGIFGKWKAGTKPFKDSSWDDYFDAGIWFVNGGEKKKKERNLVRGSLAT